MHFLTGGQNVFHKILTGIHLQEMLTKQMIMQHSLSKLTISFLMAPSVAPENIRKKFFRFFSGGIDILYC